MLHVLVALQAFALSLRDRVEAEDGATAVEYGLMVALIAVVIIAAVEALGLQLGVVFDNITTELGGVAAN